jgi:hypothetical protein
MSRIHRECPNSDPPEWSVTANLRVREEPDEEEDEEEEDEGDDKEDDDDEDTDDGYSSERGLICLRVKDKARRLHQRCRRNLGFAAGRVPLPYPERRDPR